MELVVGEEGAGSILSSPPSFPPPRSAFHSMFLKLDTDTWFFCCLNLDLSKCLLDHLLALGSLKLGRPPLNIWIIR